MTDQDKKPSQEETPHPPPQTNTNQKPAQPAQNKPAPEYSNSYNNGSSYTARTGRSSQNYNKPYQSRNGSGYNKNKYNNPNNNYNGQYYNKYNNTINGYRGTRDQLNAGSMGWQGYYAPQVLYMPQQMMPINNAGMMEVSPIPSLPTTEGRAGSVSPQRKKIEITTKSGEHLDLDEIRKSRGEHSSKQSSPAIPISTKDSIDKKLENPFLKSKTSSPALPSSPKASTPEASNEGPSKVATETVNNTEPVEEKITDAEKTRKQFLEQVRLRKLALEKKKNVDVNETSKPVEKEKVQVPVMKEEEKVKEPEVVEGEKVEEPEKPSEPKEDIDEPVKSSDLETKIVTESQETVVETPVIDEVETESKTEAAEVSETKEETVTEADDVAEETHISMTDLLEKLKTAKPIDDVYSFSYPAELVQPEVKYQKKNVKYTYGPAFLLQFKDKIKVTPDTEWKASTQSKIVIPPGMNRSFRPRDGSSNVRFNQNQGPGGRDFRSGSMRNDMSRRMDSRTMSSKRNKSSRRGGMDDRRSNRSSYVSRKDRELHGYDEKPKEEVAPFVPSANRWVPKSKVKKTEKKFAPDGVTELLDKEEVERKMKSLLNKLTLEKFDPISSEILTIAEQSKWETTGETLSLVIEQIFLKACDEPHWSSMYAQLCGKVVKELNPDIIDENNEGKKGPMLVLHYLVDRCHTEFQKGWTDKLPTNEDGSPLEPEMMSDEYYQAASAKRRGLGLVRFIGYLYRLNLLTGKMMFECFRRLMKDLTDNPSEDILESVVELLTTVGAQFENDHFRAGNATLEGSALLDSLFQIIQTIIDGGAVSNRIKFKLIDIKELREKKHWNSEKKDSGPKTIQQIHQEEEAARQLKSNSRASSRRVNHSTSGSNRNTYKRDYPSSNKERYNSARAPSTRHNPRQAPKEEQRSPAPAATNMFDALMDANEDD
ncbi:hypothetical protein NCAS_0A05870 [Naumovozyma castellii]|uniref:MIF4G domain-containing protein n=1 Tax=Naumovozyma castellii TaxID=27288 RepID=G0V6P9_NAUCA|nr:hypothetical protein NCAS_0A05870 [Naumovozyma castellii CBS 4309]CCC67145.1 hypothetical protein NCAS_0A05870 [Naumovozyma castellii CBS 4309]